MGSKDDPAHFILIPHTHWDREWYLPFESFRHRLVRLIDKLIHIMEANPTFRSFHLDGQTVVLEDYEEVGSNADKLRKLVARGRIQVGPWYVLPDEFLVSGEALIRNLERGHAVCRRFGTEPARVGYLPDMFGHVAQMPQILRGFGLDTAIMWRGMDPAIRGNVFTWQAPDGSEVFTAFLPLGYGAASNLPQNADLFIERIEKILPFIGTDGDVLLLNGSDHVEPDTEIMRTLAEAVRSRPGWSWEFSEVETWIDSKKESVTPESTHKGELRSSERTVILPGVASARLYLKKLDFSADSMLVRYAEPLAALSRALGGPDRTGMIDHAWRLLLQNHPHDSICGCSVDEVHDEMETRYRKVLQVCERLAAEAMEPVINNLARDGVSLVAYNPTSDRAPCMLVGEVEGRIRHALALADDHSESSLQVLGTIEPEEVLMDTTIGRGAGMVLLGELVSRELFGLYLHSAKISVRNGMLYLRLDAGRGPSGIDPKKVRADVEKALARPGVSKVKIKVTRLARHRIAARLPNMDGCGARSFRLVKRKGSREKEMELGPDHVENEHVKIQFEPGGTCLLFDKAAGKGYRCLRFLDVGDRGDTYNFDPLPDQGPICEPEKVSLKPLARGPVAATVEIRHRFRVPKSIHAARHARSRKSVPLDLTTLVTVYRDFPRVDFITSFENPACDHRLQAAVRLPFETDRFWVESPFALVERPVGKAALPGADARLDPTRQLLGAEGTYTTSPHKTVALVREGEHGLAIMNRGMAEVDAVKLEGATRISLTMVRSVGWLSRGDLAMRTGDAGPSLQTPGAQCLRPFTWEYAIMPFKGDNALALAQAHAFAYPMLLSLVHGRSEGPNELKVVEVDNPAVHPSAVRPLADGGIEARLVNFSSESQEYKVSWGKWWTRPRLVDFRGEDVEDGSAKLSSSEARLVLGPARIATLRLAPAR